MLGEERGAQQKGTGHGAMRIGVGGGSGSEFQSQDNHDELMELIKLSGLLLDAEVDRVIEIGRLATLVRDVSKVLEDLGISLSYPVPRKRERSLHMCVQDVQITRIVTI
jgi:hypothetical protein